MLAGRSAALLVMKVTFRRRVGIKLCTDAARPAHCYSTDAARMKQMSIRYVPSMSAGVIRYVPVVSGDVMNSLNQARALRSEFAGLFIFVFIVSWECL